MHRVETLREFHSNILKGVWLKPFLGPFSPDVDFSGMLDVVAAGEVASNFRPFQTDALIHCASAAKTAGANFTLEGLAAKSWLTARERKALEKMVRRLKRK